MPVRSVLFGATMEAVAGMLIHSTALRPVTAWPSVHLQCLCSVCKCCAAAVVMTMRVCESLVLYICSAPLPSPAVRFSRCHASLYCYRQQEGCQPPLIQRPAAYSAAAQATTYLADAGASALLSSLVQWLANPMHALCPMAPIDRTPPTIPARSDRLVLR